MSPDNVLPISKDEVAKRFKDIGGWIEKLSFKPKSDEGRTSMISPELLRLLQESSAATGTSMGGESVSILNNLKRFGDGMDLLTENANVVANTIKYGYSLGFIVLGMYDKASGQANLRQIKSVGTLNDQQIAEFDQRNVTGGAIALFISSYYIVWKLMQYKNDTAGDRVIPDLHLPEFTISNALQAAKFSLYYFGKLSASEQVVPDDVALIKFTIEYFTLILDELDLYITSLKYTEEFENRNYKLEDSEFVIRGFERNFNAVVVVKEFKKVKWEEIVGNRDFKHAQRRLIQSVMCYDLIKKMNPMVELGGARTLTLGKGPAGTGKSLAIAATATEFQERCTDLKIDFLFNPFPKAVIDEYQGKSAKNVAQWFQSLRDYKKIIYGPIDDAENVFLNRSSRSASEGVRGVIAETLTATEGAEAVIHGNYALQSFTNRAEDLDPAILSRHQTRTEIAGAVTWQDFLDQDFLWWSNYNKYEDGFVKIMSPKDYVYFTNQKLLASLSELYANSADMIPQHETVRNIFIDISKQFNPEKEDEFYGRFYEAIKKSFPFFTSRDLRNIQMAISERIMDFDFPSEWMKDNGLFFAKDYDTKKKMLIEQMKVNMKDLSFLTIRRQEAIKYIDATVIINETQFETKVKEQLEQMRIINEARRRYENETKS